VQRQAEGVASLSLEEHGRGAPLVSRNAQSQVWGPSNGEPVGYAEPPQPSYSAEEDRPPAEKRRCREPPPDEAPLG
jgi:hypothetical protein